jgi:hypothetical protein
MQWDKHPRVGSFHPTTNRICLIVCAYNCDPVVWVGWRCSLQAALAVSVESYLDLRPWTPPFRSLSLFWVSLTTCACEWLQGTGTNGPSDAAIRTSFTVASSEVFGRSSKGSYQGSSNMQISQHTDLNIPNSLRDHSPQLSSYFQLR